MMILVVLIAFIQIISCKGNPNERLNLPQISKSSRHYFRSRSFSKVLHDYPHLPSDIDIFESPLSTIKELYGMDHDLNFEGGVCIGKSMSAYKPCLTFCWNCHFQISGLGYLNLCRADCPLND